MTRVVISQFLQVSLAGSLQGVGWRMFPSGTGAPQVHIIVAKYSSLQAVGLRSQLPCQLRSSARGLLATTGPHLAHHWAPPPHTGPLTIWQHIFSKTSRRISIMLGISLQEGLIPFNGSSDPLFDYSKPTLGILTSSAN